MWRRYGDSLLGLLVFVAFFIEAAGFTGLMAFFVLNFIRVVGGKVLLMAVLAGVAFSAVPVFLLAAYTLAYHLVSDGHRRRELEQAESWNDVWIRVLYGEAVALPRPLPKAAAASLLELREKLRGQEAELLRQYAVQYDVGKTLVRGLQTRRLGPSLDALEGLAKAKLSEALPILFGTMVHEPRAVLRLMAARAAARTLADMPESQDKVLAHQHFAACLRRADLPSGVVEECLTLLGPDAGGEVIDSLLNEPALSIRLLQASLESAGRLRLSRLSPRVAEYASHPDPQLRAVSLRVLSHMGALPHNFETTLQSSLTDRIDFVRVQATRAAALLPLERATQALWTRLGDQSWWVRLSAAQSLASLGEAARPSLIRACERHPDRFARDIARQVLFESTGG